MKKLQAIFFLLFLHGFSIAQTETITGNAFITTLDNMVVYGISQGKIDRTKVFKISKGTKFNVNGFDEDNNIRVTFWRYSAPQSLEKSAMPPGYSTTYTNSREFISSWANHKEFVMELKVFNLGCKIYYGSRKDFSWGVMTLPIKARLGDGGDRFFDVEENLNLGFTFGLRQQLQGRKQQALNFLLGISIARVRTDSISLKNNFPAPQSSVSSALMFSAGTLFQHENFQVGFFTGIDNIMGALGRNWKFQGKPWIGFAIGVSLFSNNVTQAGDQNNSNK